ncbi:Uncharacterized protein dnm_000840 [Desulfonema magnum]|uniref:Uncharacterized protein n=1 Tax=Desulfonema magnum TaxID=45655 RepID=A0A975BES6_9BACT|nr:Uncharacterized protein dnm_000840 [Desulfonema magnum]
MPKPAKAGIRFGPMQCFRELWIPAFAGMTENNLVIEGIKLLFRLYAAFF